MTPNKQFNTYKEGLDLEFLQEYCMEHGERRTFLLGETLEEAGEPAQWVAFVERGCFKYMVHNDEEGKDYCTSFAFEGEFVADFPYCLDGDVSEVSIEADMPCEVRVISGRELQALFDNDPKMMLHNVRILKNLFKMVYGRDLDHYRYTARSRYRRLIDRCPQVVQMLSLKDIASFLNITPSYLSTLRKELTNNARFWLKSLRFEPFFSDFSLTSFRVVPSATCFRASPSCFLRLFLLFCYCCPVKNCRQ